MNETPEVTEDRQLGRGETWESAYAQLKAGELSIYDLKRVCAVAIIHAAERDRYKGLLTKQTEYSIQLQKMIEDHCQSRPIRYRDLHHNKMLVKAGARITTLETENKKLTEAVKLKDGWELALANGNQRIGELEAALREAINLVELHYCEEKEHGQPCLICEDALPRLRRALTQTEEKPDD